MNIYYLVSEIPTENKKKKYKFSTITFIHKILYLHLEITKHNSLDVYACLMQFKGALEI